jgi:hypothetical protein
MTPVWQVQQDSEPRAAFDQGADRRAVGRTGDQIALPMPGHGSVAYRLVYRLGQQMPPRLVGELATQRPTDLLWAPPLPQPLGHEPA